MLRVAGSSKRPGLNTRVSRFSSRPSERIALVSMAIEVSLSQPSISSFRRWLLEDAVFARAAYTSSNVPSLCKALYLKAVSGGSPPSSAATSRPLKSMLSSRADTAVKPHEPNVKFRSLIDLMSWLTSASSSLSVRSDDQLPILLAFRAIRRLVIDRSSICDTAASRHCLVLAIARRKRSVSSRCRNTRCSSSGGRLSHGGAGSAAGWASRLWRGRRPGRMPPGFFWERAGV